VRRGRARTAIDRRQRAACLHSSTLVITCVVCTARSLLSQQWCVTSHVCRACPVPAAARAACALTIVYTLSAAQQPQRHYRVMRSCTCARKAVAARASHGAHSALQTTRGPCRAAHCSRFTLNNAESCVALSDAVFAACATRATPRASPLSLTGPDDARGCDACVHPWKV
jgi:hypothetical protein